MLPFIAAVVSSKRGVSERTVTGLMKDLQCLVKGVHKLIVANADNLEGSTRPGPLCGVWGFGPFNFWHPKP